MPFRAFVIPRICAKKWSTFAYKNRIANSVYILFGDNYIYAGKSCNSDRIESHVIDRQKREFKYQLLFSPNNNNEKTQDYWTAPFMNYLESILISKIKTNDIHNYCGNIQDGMDLSKCERDLNYSQNILDYANNVADLVIAAFISITFRKDLIPERFIPECVRNTDKPDEIEYLSNDAFDKETLEEKSQDEKANLMYDFWEAFKKQNDKFEKNKTPYNYYMWKSYNNVIPDSNISCVIMDEDCRVVLELDKDQFDRLKEKYSNFTEHADFSWERDIFKRSRISIIKKGLSYLNKENWDKIFDFFNENYIKIQDTFKIHKL